MRSVLRSLRNPAIVCGDFSGVYDVLEKQLDFSTIITDPQLPEEFVVIVQKQLATDSEWERLLELRRLRPSPGDAEIAMWCLQKAPISKLPTIAREFDMRPERHFTAYANLVFSVANRGDRERAAELVRLLGSVPTNILDRAIEQERTHTAWYFGHTKNYWFDACIAIFRGAPKKAEP